MFRGNEVEEERFLTDRVRTRFYPADKKEPIPHKMVSTQLADAVKAFAPDLIIFKGLSYAIARFVHERMPHIPFGFIIGGSVADPILDSARFVFGEYQEQLDTFFPQFVAAGCALVLPKFIPPEVSKLTRAATPSFDIINVGNFHEKRKNQVDLLPFSTDYRIALVGGDRMPEEWEPLIPNKENIALLGRLSQDDVLNAMLRSKVMVHSSTMDGLPRSMIESLAVGTPTIAYRSTVWGGIEEGEHGFLVTPETLPHAIALLVRDDRLRNTMSRKARAYAEKFHGLSGLRRTAKQFAADLAGGLLSKVA